METKIEEQIEIINAKWLSIDEIEPNDGQIEGIPSNPRTIQPDDFEKLKKSITDNPEMLGLRDCYVKEHQGSYVMIDGNMRLKALQDLGFSKVICKVIPEHWTPQQVMSLIIKANLPFGDWDRTKLQEDWDSEDLKDWGLDMIPDAFDGDIDSLFQDAENSGSKEKHFEIRLQFAEDMETEAEIIKAKIKEALSEYPYMVK